MGGLSAAAAAGSAGAAGTGGNRRFGRTCRCRRNVGVACFESRSVRTFGHVAVGAVGMRLT